MTSAYSSVVLAYLLTMAEALIPQQFPSSIGHAYLTIPNYVTLAHFGGVQLYAFFSFLFILEIIRFIRVKSIQPVLIGSVFNLFFVLPFIPQIRPHVDLTQMISFNVRIVQANIGNLLKLESEDGKTDAVAQVIETYEKLSTSPAKSPLDLIIWPETAYPYSMKSSELIKGKDFIPYSFSHIIKQMNAELAIGAYDSDPNLYNSDYYESEYNSVFHFDTNSKVKNVYHKRLLIPFGETLPLGPLKPYAKELIQNISYFATGKYFVTFTHGKNIRFISPICYEILFADYMRDYLNNSFLPPHFILNVTNDSWYGDTAEPHQHLFLGKWRALEFNIPIIRSTNTGITSVIFPDGSESKRLVTGEKNVLDINLQLPQKPIPTFYQKFGLGAVTIVFLIILASSIFTSRPIELEKLGKLKKQ